MKTFHENLQNPDISLSRWGVTLIPPESLGIFQEIVLQDKRINVDDNLTLLANMIQKAIDENKFMIHFGV